MRLDGGGTTAKAQTARGKASLDPHTDCISGRPNNPCGRTKSEASRDRYPCEATGTILRRPNTVESVSELCQNRRSPSVAISHNLEN